MRSVLNAGMVATSHTDAPVALPNLMQVMWATVNRLLTATGPALKAAGGLTGKGIGLSNLAPAFKTLGVSPAVATRAVPIVTDYIGNKAGPEMATRLLGILK